jgi:diacylglycerol O-acyltransferase / wax synthase
MRTPLANVDATWHRMDEPANHMVVTGVLIFDEPVSRKHLRALLERRLLRFMRFRQRIVEPIGGVGALSWEEDPDFSIDHHLILARLPAPRDERALQAFTSALASRALPSGRPPWRFHFVPRYQGGSALIVRLHHSIGDGLALVHVLLSLADGAPEPAEATHHEAHPVGVRESVWASLARVAKAAVALRRAKAANHLATLVRLLLLPPDPRTSFKGPLGNRKKLVWSPAFRLEEFKAVGTATDTTLNDILMTALAGALRRYLLARSVLPADLDVRAVVPVNLRPANEAHLLGNRFGLVFLSLPLGDQEALPRLKELHRRMLALKKSPDAAATWMLLWVMGQLPRPLFDLVVDLFATKATTVVTNVVGPREAIWILGARLRQAMFWVPCAGHLGLGVSLLSYAGSAWVGVQVDGGLIPDPEQILTAFEEELKALRVLPLRAESRHRSHRARTPRTTGQPMGLGVTGPCS